MSSLGFTKPPEGHDGYAQGYSSNSNPFQGEIGSIDFVQIALILRRRVGLIIACIIVLTTAAIFYASQLPKQYTSTAQIEIQPPQVQVLELQDMDNRGANDSAFITTQIELLKSRRLHRKMVDKLGLMWDASFNPSAKKRKNVDSSDGLRGLVASSAEAGLEPDETDEKWTEAQIHAVVNSVMDMTNAEQIGKTHLVTVSASSQSPSMAAKLANALIDVYVNDNRDRRLKNYQDTTDWLNEEIDQIREKLAIAQSEAEAYRSKYSLGQAAGDSITDQQLSELNGLIVIARADLAQAKARFSRLQNLQSSGSSADSLSEALSSPVIQNLREKKSELIRERSEFSTKYDSLHPKMLEIKTKLQDLNYQINEEVKRVSASMENEVEVAESRVRSLENSMEELQGTDASDEQARIALNQLEHEVEANRKLLDNLLESQKQTAILSGNKSLQPVAVPQSEAAIPRLPSGPKMRQIAIFAFAASLGFGIGLAFFLEAIDQGISTGKEVEDRLRVTHLASIPANKGLFNLSGLKSRHLHDHIIDRPLSQFAEAFRSLRSNLVLLNVEQPPQVVLVTSALAQEGKTTTSICLARTAAKSGIKTLLIDGDFRNPSIGERLDIHTNSGFVEVLAQKADLEDCIFADHRSPLDILPISKAVFAQPDLLNSQTVASFFDHIRNLYDFIVVDGAPVLPVSDSTILSRRADATVFTLKWEATPRRAAESAIIKLKNAKATNIGVALAQVNLERLKAYGYGDDLYYAGQYGHAMDKMKKSWFKRKGGKRSLFGRSKESELASEVRRPAGFNDNTAPDGFSYDNVEDQNASNSKRA